jgi:hypothetical protein
MNCAFFATTCRLRPPTISDAGVRLPPASNLVQVARGMLGLTKLNYNFCQLGEGQPITVKYSDRVGEILLANPGLSSDKWKHNFKYYT